MPPSESPTTTPASAKLSAEDQADLDAVNSSIDRMREINQSGPYILTIPQDVEPRYHHQSQAYAMQWLTQSPFQWKEGEAIQYQTWVYHEHGRDMYVLHNSMPREESATRSRAGTGPSTPSTAPKKKISLDAYKKKQSGTPATQEAPAAKAVDAPVKPPAVKGPVERLKAETEEVLAAVPQEADVAAPVPRAEPEKGELKRKRDSITGEGVEKQDAASTQEPVAKKARPATPPPATMPVEQAAPPASQEVKPVAQRPTTPPRNHVEESLPPKLSPLHAPSLPCRLSPTLPASIEASLKQREQLRSSTSEAATSAPNSASKNGMLTPGKKADGIVKHKSPVPRNGFRANSSSPAIRSDAEDKAPPTSAPAKNKSPQLSREESISVGKALKEKQQRKPSLIVKLKYKKHHSESIQRLLKVRPTPDKDLTPLPTTAPKAAEASKQEKAAVKKRDPAAKGVAQKIGPAPRPAKPAVPKEEAAPRRKPDQPATTSKEPSATESPPSKKRSARPAEETEEPASKRKKAAEATETKKEPSTPVPRTSDSPVQQTSTQKSQVTPSVCKDHLSSAAMIRQPSTDSNHVETPSVRSTSTPLTNGATSQPNGLARSVPPGLSNKTPEQEAWETEQRRLEMLGRELKHTVTAHIKNMTTAAHSDPQAREKEQMLGAIKSVESLLAYLLAFTCADRAAAAADPRQSPPVKNWQSLHAYFPFVRDNCAAYPLLAGIAGYLAMAFNAHTQQIIYQHYADRNLDAFWTAYRGLLKFGSETGRKLDVDTVIEKFPRTWGLRHVGPLPADADQLCAPGMGAFAGAFKLPITPFMSPLQAARAGYSMLGEWMDRQPEALGYELKLKL
jgi:hypothetical protein